MLNLRDDHIISEDATDITSADATKTKKLALIGKATNFDDLKYFPNVNELTIQNEYRGYASISLEPLAQLKKLEKLEITSERTKAISDLKPLGKKTITTTYDVDKDTGKLTNPKKHTSVPIGILTPSKHSPKTVTFKNGDSKIGSVKVEAGKAIATDGLIDQSMPNNPSKEELIRAIKS